VSAVFWSMIKSLIRSILFTLKIDFTKNLEYDRLTKTIMKQVIKPDSNCIDVGCHKGEILDLILKYAPAGKHYAFEPIPVFFDFLNKKYHSKITLYPYALSETNGNSTFNYVRNAPAYSGIKQRKYDIAIPDIEKINVEVKALDSLLPENEKIDFIKIDVEGAEFGVLKGARNIIKKNHPIIIFESGLGASDYYGTNPSDLFDFLTNETELKVSLLSSFIKNKPTLSKNEFVRIYNNNKEYYYIAHP
jgi:FkbM family methyltransferase